MAFLFEIIGDPVPQKQLRCSCAKGFAHLYSPSKKDKEKIQWQIKPFAPKTPLAGPIEMTLVFFLKIPKSTSSKVRKGMLNRVILPAVYPDEDNLAYIVTNALKKIVYNDDRQICVKHVYKFYGEEPKTVIKIREILTLDPLGYHACDI